MAKRQRKLKFVREVLSFIPIAVSFLLIGLSIYLAITPGFTQILSPLFYYVLFIGIIGSFLLFVNLKNVIKSRWITMTIFLMVLFFVTGTMIISHTFGESDLSLALRDCETKQIVGNITCKDANGRLFAENEIYCELSPKPFQIVSANVSFRLDNGGEKTIDFSNYTFTAPYNSNYIFFKISGLNVYNQSSCTEIGYPFRFYTKEENDDRNNKIVSYMILLLGAVLFSVPQMMKNFMDMNGSSKK